MWVDIMKKVTGLFAFIALAMLVHVEAQAETQSQGVDAEQFYVGGGLGFNSLSGANATGFQIIGGYEFKTKLNDDITSALEIGYMDTGNFERYGSTSSGDDVNGAWFAWLGSVPLTRKAGMLARLGYDFGDDDGLLLGTGMQYKFTTKVAMRMEYVARQHVNSLQANVLFKF
jgi:opacity protein-like surface antigen